MKANKWRFEQWSEMIIYSSIFSCRIRNLQLYLDFLEWNGIKCSVYGNMWHCLHTSGFGMRFEIDGRWEGNFRWCFICWYNLFITFMGIFGWYERTTLYHPTNAFSSCSCIMCFIISSKLLPARHSAFSQWFFVS